MTTERKTRLDTRAVLLVLFCAFFWGVGQVAIKASLVEIGPLWQAGLRSLGEPITLRLCVTLAALAVGVALVNRGR